MSNTIDKTLSRIYLLSEIDNSIHLVEISLALLQKYGRTLECSNSFMLLMSTALERLMKIILNLYEFKKSNRFLSTSELKKYGHDLIKLRNATFKMLTSQASSNDTLLKEFSKSIEDELVNELLIILSDFAKVDRYVYLEGVNSPKIPEKMPIVRLGRAISKGKTSSDELFIIFKDLALLLCNVLIECELLDTAEVASPRLSLFVDIAKEHRGHRQYSL